MNFNCVYPSCDFKKNDIEEEEFLKHLNDMHHDEMKEASERESIPIKMIEMISVSNSKQAVFPVTTSLTYLNLLSFFSEFGVFLSVLNTPDAAAR